ncbi:poly(A)-nuclease subunit, putative [Candida dubliniensis CD36]|uniref:PAN2-PAN3 deadenylation complex subunit PAN3 n=1 Tax=Candida dubliniensis (strain CD36 / ATCC MYA-646 / CBS 7987 / NCPF 3949 / NRRL Y-17841) TaxID=573826 RepID=B9WI59_CANDC|nr:poly(A)-nuclease subunit, putative [Candida dubliniensis CD36]CAX41856.1 poly(A)-nuclease subunit, putative [Candida dubliniensis CD36]
MNINLDTAKDTLCKNILIYGYCKYENKGCAFSHNRQQPTQQQQATNTSNNSTSVITPNSANSTASSTDLSLKKKFNLNTPSFQPSINNLSNKFSTLSPKLKEIPVFKPENGVSEPEPVDSPTIQRPFTSKRFNVSTPSFTPTNFDFANNTNADGNRGGASTPIGISSAPLIQNQQQQQQQQQQQKQPLAVPSPLATGAQPPSLQHRVLSMGASQSSPSTNPYFANNLDMSAPTPGSETPGPVLPGSAGAAANQPMYPLQYHLYAPAPPPRLTIPLQPYESNSQTMFIPNDLREYLHKKNEASLQSLGHSNLPEHVNQYHSLVPIDKSYEPVSKLWLGKNSLIFKCLDNIDGNLYVMRKIEPCNEIVNDKPFKTVKRWKSIKNANIVGLKDAFTTMAFNGNQSGNTALCIIYDYYPNSISLLEHHKKGLRVEPVNETLLWNYLIQLINAIMVIHEKGLSASSTIDLSKIIVTNKNRIKLSSVGISDILEFNDDETKQDIKIRQLQDIQKVGKVLMELAILLLPANMRQSNNVYNSLKASTNLSEDIVNNLRELNDLDTASEEFDLSEFSKRLTPKMFSIIDSLQNSSDFIEGQLTSELENARLFRLMTKLNYLIHDNSNTENDKIIKLFLNYVYNCYDSNNKKVINLNKVLTNLNKLDCGIDEKILLVNNDECIIISYKELKEIIDTKFRLMRE